MPETKTRKQRMVGVPVALATAIREHRAWLDTEGHAGRHSALLYPSRRGTPLTHNRISEALAAARKQTGITARFTSHGFRRSLTVLLQLAEVDPVIAAQITGHETAHASLLLDHPGERSDERCGSNRGAVLDARTRVRPLMSPRRVPAVSPAGLSTESRPAPKRKEPGSDSR